MEFSMQNYFSLQAWANKCAILNQLLQKFPNSLNNSNFGEGL